MPKVIDETKIFDAALDILTAHGYEGATTKKIAAAAGVNEVTLFRNYKSKAGLFQKAIEHKLSDTPLQQLEFTGDLEADILAIVETYLQTNELYGNIIPILLIELPRNPDLRGSFSTPWKNIQVMVDMIHHYQLKGSLKTEPPLSSLSALIGPILVSQMLQRTHLDLPIPVFDVQAHTDCFLNGRRAEE